MFSVETTNLSEEVQGGSFSCVIFPHTLVESHIGKVSNVPGKCRSICDVNFYQPEVCLEGLKLGDDLVCQGAVETPAAKGLSSRILMRIWEIWQYQTAEISEKLPKGGG